MSQLFVVVSKIGRLFLGILFKFDLAAPNQNPVPGVQPVFELWLAVNKDFVSAAPDLAPFGNPVHNLKYSVARGMSDMCVVAGRPGIVKDHTVIRGPSNRTDCLGAERVLPLATA